MKRSIVIIAALCAFCLNGQAQTMPFLNVNSDAASAAVANTGVGRAANAFAVANNMAAASLAPGVFAAEIGYGLWQPKVSLSGIVSAAGFMKFNDRMAVGVDFKNFNEAEYDITTMNGSHAGTFKPSEMAAGLGLSYRLSDRLAVGVNAKFACASLAESAKGTSFAGGISLAYAKDGLQAGLAVDNLGGKVDYGTGILHTLPSIVKAGASYTVSRIYASAELDYIFNGGLKGGLGAEYQVNDFVAVRAGLHLGDRAKAMPSYASAGLGVNLEGVKFNAAYLFGSKILGGSLLFGLGYSF